MKKLFVLLVGMMMLFVQQVFSQNQPLSTIEGFEGQFPPTGWAEKPVGFYTMQDANFFVSGSNSCRVSVPPMVGNEVIWESDGYNLANYSYVTLRFWHICKVSPSDTVRLEIGYWQGPGIYGNWKPLPSSSSVYKGAATNYGSTGFNAASYTVWNESVNNAVPNNNTWWKQEEFDLKNDAGQQNVKFRFVIKRGKTSGTQTAYGWLIDNFEVIASKYIIDLPKMNFVSPFVHDTVTNTGPFTINAKVKFSVYQIVPPKLVWTINGIKYDTLTMVNVAGDSLWKETIPQYPAGTKISYHIIGTDTAGNMGTIYDSCYVKRYCSGSTCNDTNSVTLLSIDMKDTIPTALTACIPIVVTLQNKGIANLDSVKVYYTVNSGPVKDTTIKFPSNPDPFYWEYIKQITVGCHTFTPGGTDLLTVWVGYPNGKLDNVRTDDTIKNKKIYGAKDITAKWDDIPGDTVYYTGPIAVSAKIVSITAKPLNNIKLYYKTTSTSGTDSVVMTTQGKDIYEAAIPHVRYESKVQYWIQLTDYLGNVIRLDSNYYIQKVCGYEGGSSNPPTPASVHPYTGSVVPVTLDPGTYDIECWGANGGDYTAESKAGGIGGYSKGTIKLTSTTTLYVAVGGRGGNSGSGATGGFNGGGYTNTDANSQSGGGATHVATVTGQLASLSSTKNSVIIVAGGGGAIGSTTTVAGHGGGLNGIDGTVASSGGTQTTGGINGTTTNAAGIFGSGAYYSPNTIATISSGGGGGWYGGAWATRSSASAGGGSSYIQTSTTLTALSIVPTIPLSSGVTYAGNDVSKPANPDIAGNGYVKITPVGGSSGSSGSTTPGTFAGYIYAAPQDSISNNTQNTSLFLSGNAAAWSRHLYNNPTLLSGINTSQATYINSIAFRFATSVTKYPRIHVKAVTQSTHPSTGYIDPTTDGATLVFQGQLTTSSTGWTNITFIAPFLLPAGNHLMVYVEESNNTTVTADIYGSNTYPALANERSYWSTTKVSSGATSARIPITRFETVTSGSGSSSGGGNLVVGTPQDYTYKGSAEPVTLPKGSYQLEVWGAKGGDVYTVGGGGKGGYSKGILTLTSPETIYIYVGGAGGASTTVTTTPTAWGGWNGGGGSCVSNGYGAGGGGATDIRLGGTSATNRVIVAGGGGGAAMYSSSQPLSSGGNGGGVAGANGDYTVSSGTTVVGGGGAGANGATPGFTYINFPLSSGTATGGGGGALSGATTNTHGQQGTGGGTGGSPGGGGGLTGCAGGGGGGYAGGGAGVTAASASATAVNNSACAGGGGSGYIGGVTSGITVQATDPLFVTNPATNGNGYVRITPVKIISGNGSGGHGNCKDSNSVALEEILSPAKIANAGTLTPVKVQIRNVGIKDLNSCNLGWKLNGVLQADNIPYTRGLPEDFTDTITIGSYTPIFGKVDTLCVWVKQPNGAIDSVTSDDTITNFISRGCTPPLTGTYTVGQGRTFTTIKDAFASMKECGVGGNITLELKGTFPENVDLANLSTLMGNYSLTITSAGNHPDSAIIVASGTAGIVLGNTKNLTLRAITVNARTNMATYAMQFTSACKDILIRDCKFLHDTTTTTSTYHVVYKATGIDTNISFINNLIEGGYHGFHYYGGIGTGATQYGYKIVFDSNTIRNQYANATYFYYINFTSLSYNKVTSRTTTISGWNGLYPNNCNGPIIGNRIVYRGTSTSTFYQLRPSYYHYSTYGGNVTGTRGTIANNELISLVGTGTQYGIYCSYTYADIVNNSIYHGGTSGTTHGISINAYTTVTMFNNNIVLKSTGTAYPISHASTTSVVISGSDYNNLQAPTYVGYANAATACTTLVQWRTAISNDYNSVKVQPAFVDPTIKLDLSNNNGFTCPVSGNAPSDIEGTTRYPTTTIGAYEYPIPPYDVAIIQLRPLEKEVVDNQSVALTADIQSLGMNNVTSVTFGWSVNGSQPQFVTSPVNPALASFQTRNNVPAGNFTANGNIGDKFNVVVWVEEVNGSTVLDTVKRNDTARATYVIAPLVEFTTPLVGEETSQTSLDVYAIIRGGTGAPISLPPYLVYRAVLGDCWGKFDSVPMTKSGDKWKATVPSPLYYGSKVVYWVTVSDGTNTCTAIDSTRIVYSSGGGDTLSFAYTGSVVPVLLKRGIYQLECWGAQGGTAGSYTEGGRGGYSVGTLTLTSNSTVYVYVGGAGSSGANVPGGFNGGGLGYSSNSRTMTSGGGASDIRIGVDSLYSRVIVAGGGGGGYETGVQGDGSTRAFGGGLTGGDGTSPNTGRWGTGGTQTAGGAYATGTNSWGGTIYAGSFGLGGYSVGAGYSNGGGSGWYGGGASIPDGGGGGGSGWVYTASTFSTWQAGNPSDASKYILNSTHYLANASTTAGSQTFLSPLGVSETGHKGSGYVRITPLKSGGEAYPGKHLAMMGIVSPENDLTLDCAPDSADVVVMLTNIGTHDYYFLTENIEVGYQITAPRNTVYTGTIPIMSGELLSEEEMEITLVNKMPVMYSGNYTIKAWVVVADDFSCDDTLTYIFTSSRTGLPIDERFSNPAMPKEFISNITFGDAKWEPTQSSAVQPNFGNGVLRFESADGVGGAEFHTRQLDLFNAVNPSLEFWYYNDTTYKADRSFMEVSIYANGVPTQELYINRYEKDSVHGWNHYTVPLNNYTNAGCVSIWFDATNIDYSGKTIAQYIDRVWITAEQNLRLNTMIVPQLANCDYSNKSIQLVLENTKMQYLDYALSHPNITFEVRKGNNIVSTRQITLNSGGIQPNWYDTLTINNVNLETGALTLVAYVNPSFDSNPSDDTVRLNITIDPDVEITLIKETSSGCLDEGYPVNQRYTIKNNSNSVDLYNIPVRIEVQDGNGSWKETKYDTVDVLLKGATRPLQFADAYAVPFSAGGSYVVVADAELDCDINKFNNNNRDIFECVTLGDIEMFKVLTPTGDETVGASVSLKVQINNKSPMKQYDNVGVHALISDGTILDGIVTLPAGKVTEYTFTTPYTVPNAAEYTIKVFVDNQDYNAKNDTLKPSYQPSGQGVWVVKNANFTLGQNIPNPAQNSTRIDYSVPEEGQVIFTVYTIAGQALFVEKHDAHSGKNDIKFNTQNLANGVYYYSMEYKGERLVKKMTIRR